MTEEGIIKKAIMDFYHEGHVRYKPELYDEILHDEWRFFFYDREGNFKIVDKEAYKSWYNPDEKPKGLDWYTEILNIDITGNNASVKLKIGNQTVEFTDYFNMIKIDGKWWVVNKLSSAKRFE
ncbi:MAG: nuclear transport factor 2 family protein [Candidatus Thorarchaeota archaeon]